MKKEKKRVLMESNFYYSAIFLKDKKRPWYNMHPQSSIERTLLTEQILNPKDMR